MPEYQGRGSDRTLTACTAGPFAVRHGAPASRAVRTQSALRPTCDSRSPSHRSTAGDQPGCVGDPVASISIARTVRIPSDAIAPACPASRRGAAVATQSIGTVRRASAAWRYRLASGRIFRSTYNASCLRRNRFSATSWARGCSIDEANRTTSPRTQTIARTSRREADWIIDGGYLACAPIADRAGRPAWDQRYLAQNQPNFSDPVFADHNSSTSPLLLRPCVGNGSAAFFCPAPLFFS